MWSWKINRARKGIGQGAKGFTLLEVLIAIAILAVVFTTLFGSQSYSLSLATEARFNIIATSLLRTKLAEVEAGILAPESDQGEFGSDFPGFTWRLEASDAVFDHPALSELDPAMRKVELTVAWEETPYSQSVTFYLPGGEQQ